MRYEYKMVSVPKNIAVSSGKSLGQLLRNTYKMKLIKWLMKAGNFTEQTVILLQNCRVVWHLYLAHLLIAKLLIF